MAFNNHGFYFGLQLHTFVFPFRLHGAMYALSQLLKLLFEPFTNRSQVNRKNKLTIV